MKTTPFNELEDEFFGEKGTPERTAYEAQVLGESKTHVLKTWPEHFCAVFSGKKTFEVRLNDRGFKVGDILYLREWDPTTELYTGRSCYRTVVFMLRDFVGLQPGYVVLALSHRYFKDPKVEVPARDEVRDAVATILRPMRHPVTSEIPGSYNRNGRHQHMGMMAERRRNNETADTMAQSYGVDLGPWPETTGDF